MIKVYCDRCEKLTGRYSKLIIPHIPAYLDSKVGVYHQSKDDETMILCVECCRELWDSRPGAKRPYVEGGLIHQVDNK